MTNVNETPNKEYKDERFEFALYVNGNLICKRNFKINNFIEGSMNTINFKETIDNIVTSIDEDLKSKSRVYTWYYSDFFDDMNDTVLEPWECTFKFEVTDNKKLVMSRIWDGYGYPKAIREKVDITNKVVKITTKDGRTYSYDKEEYFKENSDRLTTEMYILRGMIMDKPDLLSNITKRICEVCSPREELYSSIGDYTVSEIYKSKDSVKNDDGSVKLDKNGNALMTKTAEPRKYFYSNTLTNNKYVSDWAKAVADKTKAYFDKLAEDEKVIKKFS